MLNEAIGEDLGVVLFIVCVIGLKNVIDFLREWSKPKKQISFKIK